MKIAIIGGGINGLYLAWKLAKRGEKITLFERKREIGNKVCSGLFSERILDFIPESKKLIENKINFVLIHFPKKTIRVNFSKSFFLMSHYKLDNLVAELAQKAGVKIVLNRNISSIPKGFEKIIACDGASSIIRKTLKLPEPNYRLGILGFDRNQKSDNFIETFHKLPKLRDIYSLPNGPRVVLNEKQKDALKIFKEKRKIKGKEINR